MRRLLPSYAEDLRDADLVEAYAYPTGRPWVRANMVSSLDGSAVVDGRSGGLSSAADKKVFGVLRGLCDAVVVGAGTARAEGYRAPRAKQDYADLRAGLGHRPAPVLVLVSRRLDLDPASGLFVGAAERTLVVAPASSDPAARERLADVADVVVAGDREVDMTAALAALVDRGLTRVLCEGGPHLLRDIAAAGRLDELCLTLSPHLVAGFGPRILTGEALEGHRHLGLEQLIEDEGTLLARYTAT